MIPSVEVRIVPESPTVTMIPFPYVTLLRLFVVPEVLVSIVVPSDEVTIVPEEPTATNAIVPLSVLAVLDELLDEEQDMEMKLIRNTEIMISICLIEFPISGLVNPVVGARFILWR